MRQPRAILGMTQRQTAAFRRIQALKDEFARNASWWNIDQMERIADECEELIREHFPEEVHG